MQPGGVLDALDLDAVPGTVSVWLGRPGQPHAVRCPDATHYAASTMKVAVLAAAYRLSEAGVLDLDADVPVRNEFRSAAPGGPAFGCRQSYDNDDAVWDRLDGTATLRWLGERMIVRSSNLATNVILGAVGVAAVAEVWAAAGATHSVVNRGIEDAEGAAAGLTNLVSVADLAALLTAIHENRIASAASCQAMLATLCAQQVADDLAHGLPSGTRVAYKNGWIEGIRHSAGIIYPDDASPFVLAVCLTTPLATNDQDDDACQLVARIAAAAWHHRHSL
jgi:beta-lactamase class A